MNATGTNVGAVASAPTTITAPNGYHASADPAPAVQATHDTGHAAHDPVPSAQDRAPVDLTTVEQGPVEVAIRRIRADDALLLRSLRLLALTDAPRAFSGCVGDELAVAADDWDRRALDCATRADDYVAIVTRYGTPCGLVRAYAPATATDRRELAAMWIAPWARGIGAGDALVEAVVGWARQVGARDVTLWVNLDNVAARRLYERHGFAIDGDPGGEPGEGRRWLRMTRAFAGGERVEAARASSGAAGPTDDPAASDSAATDDRAASVSAGSVSAGSGSTAWDSTAWDSAAGGAVGTRERW
jgi:ribosomal protein S18 acetylase RimI-like enzyme